MSQKEFEKIINTGEGSFHLDDLKKMKARIELIGDIEDLRKVAEFMKTRKRSDN
jgi:hypothetical protein